MNKEICYKTRLVNMEKSITDFVNRFVVFRRKQKKSINSINKKIFVIKENGALEFDDEYFGIKKSNSEER